MKTVPVNLVIKDGGYETLHIPVDMIGELVLAIHEKGSERVQTINRTLNVVGLFRISKEAGQRVIFQGLEE